MIWLIGTLFYSYEMLIKSSISAMSDILLHNYGLTAIQLSALGSSFYMVYVVLMIPAAILVDKLGVRKALITASFIAALGTMLYAFGSSFTGFAIARVVMGVGGSFAFVSALKLASQWLPARVFPLFAGFTQFIGYLGGVMSGAPLSIMVEHGNWHIIFIGISIIGFILTALILLFVKDNTTLKNLDNTSISFIEILKQIGTLLKKPQIFLNGLFCLFSMGVVFAITDIWGKIYLMNAQGLSETAAATAANSMVFLGVAITSPLWGAAATALSNNKRLIVFGGLLGTVSTTLLFYGGSNLFMLYVAGFCIGMAMASHVLNFDIVKNLVHPKIVATGMALLNMCGMLGATLLQLLSGASIHYFSTSSQYDPSHLKKGLAIIPICFLIAFIISLFIVDKPKQDIHFESIRA